MLQPDKFSWAMPNHVGVLLSSYHYLAQLNKITFRFQNWWLLTFTWLFRPATFSEGYSQICGLAHSLFFVEMWEPIRSFSQMNPENQPSKRFRDTLITIFVPWSNCRRDYQHSVVSTVATTCAYPGRGTARRPSLCLLVVSFFSASSMTFFVSGWCTL